MGNQQSTSETITNVTTEAITSVLLESSQKCEQSGSTQQTINISDIDLSGTGCNLIIDDVTQEVFAEFKLDCAQKNESQTSIANDLKLKLEQLANATNSGITIGNSESRAKALANTTTKIENNIDMKSITECVQKTLNTQDMSISNIKGGCPAFCNNPNPEPYQIEAMEKNCNMRVSNISQRVVKGAVANCLGENTSFNDVVNESAAEFAQETSAEVEGVDAFASMASMGSFLLPCVACVVLVICSFSSSSAATGGGGSGGDGPGPTPGVSADQLRDRAKEIMSQIKSGAS